MQNLKTFKQLKQMSRNQMQGKLGTLIGAMFLEIIIIYGVNSLASSFINVTDTISLVIYYLVTFIIDLLTGTIVAGMAYLHLKVACGMDASVGDMFHVIKTSPDKAIRIQLVLTLINTVLSIPAYIYSYKFGNAIVNCYLKYVESLYLYQEGTPTISFTQNILNIVGNDMELFFVLNTAVMIFGIISFIISIGFFPVFYMMLDFPNMTVKEVLTNAWSLMKGHKARYFGLQLSFIGYFILSLFTMMIPMIWVVPYMAMTNTNFYLDLISCKNGTENNVSVEA